MIEVPGAGLEPARPKGLRILSPVRLPISPPGQELANIREWHCLYNENLLKTRRLRLLHSL